MQKTARCIGMVHFMDFSAAVASLPLKSIGLRKFSQTVVLPLSVGLAYDVITTSIASSGGFLSAAQKLHRRESDRAII